MATWKTRPTRFQFSLSSMFVIVAVCGVLARLALVWEGKAKQQAAAIAKMNKMGGTVMYDYEFGANDEFDPYGRPGVPQVLLDYFGVDWFASVVAVDLIGCDIKQKNLSLLEQFP